MNSETNIPILPIAPCGRIMKKGGADRISEAAEIEMAKILEEYGILITIEAVELARHAKRTTVKEEDIRLAVVRLTRT